jgi:cold shock CspA family protein
MNGNISEIKLNDRGAKTFGFIYGNDGNDYFFHKNNLENCTIYQLEEGDCVEFEVEEDPFRDRDNAVKIRKRFSPIGESANVKVNPGINPDVKLIDFNEDEQAIVLHTLMNALYVTYADKITVGGGSYRFVLVKPTDDFSVMFNMAREIPVVFSDYISFEPRSLDVADAVAESL